VTDDQILDLFWERDENAVVEAKQKYGNRLFKTAINVLRSKEDAEESVNDTLFKAWETIPPGRPEMLGAFLAKISRNISINKLKAKSAAKRGGGLTLLLNELTDSLPANSSPEKEFEGKLVVKAINTFLSDMEKSARFVFILRYFHGESIIDISERFRISESKTKSMLFRARKKLQAFLEKEGIIL